MVVPIPERRPSPAAWLEKGLLIGLIAGISGFAYGFLTLHSTQQAIQAKQEQTINLSDQGRAALCQMQHALGVPVSPVCNAPATLKYWDPNGPLAHTSAAVEMCALFTYIKAPLPPDCVK